MSAAAKALGVLPYEKFDGVSSERFNLYHNKLEENDPDSYMAMHAKGFRLKWTHRNFGEYQHKKVYLAWFHKDTGEQHNPPSEDAWGPGMLRIVLPFCRVAFANTTPEYMYQYEKPEAQWTFVQPKDKDGEPDPNYTEEVCGRFNKVFQRLNKTLNEDRCKDIHLGFTLAHSAGVDVRFPIARLCDAHSFFATVWGSVRYLAEHAPEYFPTKADKSPEELAGLLIDALDTGLENGLAFRTHVQKPKLELLEPNHRVRNNESWSIPAGKDRKDMVDDNSMGILNAYRTYFSGPDAWHEPENLDAIARLEGDLVASMEKKQQRMLRLPTFKGAHGKKIDYIQLMRLRPGGSIAAAVVEIGAVRVMDPKTKDSKNGSKHKKPKKESTKATMKNVTVKMNLSEVIILADGRPFKAKKVTPSVGFTDVEGLSTMEEIERQKRKADDDPEGDAAMASVDFTDVATTHQAKKSKPDVDDTVPGDPPAYSI